MEAQVPQTLVFGAFTLDLARGSLRHGNDDIKLRPKSFEVLRYLVENRGRLISNEELIHAVWEDTAVSDNSVAQCLLEIRRAVGTDGQNLIRNVPRRGYMFDAPVVDHREDAGRAVEEPAASGSRARSRRRTLLLILAIIVPLALGMSVWVSRARRVETSNQNWNIRPLTRFAGQETQPDWSPDARFITFARTYPRDANIFVVPVAGGDPVQLTESPRDEFTSRWSPDGRYIAYLGDTGRTKLVYLMSPLGGESRLLADTRIPFLERFVESWKSLGAHPWSPDGRDLVFSRLDASGRISLWKINIETRQEARLTSPPAGCDDLNASWSFDNRWIAFTRTQGGLGSLWLVAAAGGEPRLLLRDANDNTAPTWSVDSRRLVFQSNRHGPQNLWEVEIASGRLRKITSGAGVDAYPATGPKGLLYSHYDDNVKLYSVELGSGSEAQLTHSTGRSYWPRISGDGRRLAYQSEESGEWDIWVLDLETGSRRRLTADAAVDLTPEWSPDGRYLSFISNRDGAFRVWVLDVEHGISRRLLSQIVQSPATITLGVGQVTQVHGWSPDGRKIGFISPTEKGAALWVAEPDGRDARQIVSGVLTFDWYRDSTHVLYTRIDPDGSYTRELVARDLNTGMEQVLYRGPHVDIAAAKDGSAVLFCYAASHVNQSLFLLPLVQEKRSGLPRPAGEPRRLTDGKGVWHAHHGSWSRDGKKVFYSRDTLEADVYLIENYR